MKQLYLTSFCLLSARQFLWNGWFCGGGDTIPWVLTSAWIPITTTAVRVQNSSPPPTSPGAAPLRLNCLLLPPLDNQRPVLCLDRFAFSTALESPFVTFWDWCPLQSKGVWESSICYQLFLFITEEFVYPSTVRGYLTCSRVSAMCVMLLDTFVCSVLCVNIGFYFSRIRTFRSVLSWLRVFIVNGCWICVALSHPLRWSCDLSSSVSFRFHQLMVK